MKPIRTRMRGASLITAIFLLVVLSALAVAMVTLSTTQQASSAMDVQGARAYLAARAGMEWGVYRATAHASCNAATTFALPAGALEDFSVTVNCSRTPAASPVPPAGSIVRHTLRVTACNQSGPAGCPNPSNSADYVQRTVQVEF